MIRLMCIAIAAMLFAAGSAAAAGTGDAPQSLIVPNAKVVHKYPKIILFSVAWCPHCKAAKEYFTHNDIPFINRDVELDAKAMEELTGKYKSHGVPVIIIGDDARILKGFDQEKLEKVLKELEKK
jgi:glutaredoxin-like YruB-family protein